VRALETDTPRVAGAAARALGALGGAEAELVRALESPSALVRGSASAALRLQSAAAIAAKLRPLMDSDRAEVRAGALVAVGPGPGRLPGEMTEKIALLLADPDARVRGAAAAALCRRDVSGMRGKLRGLFADEDPSVRLAAAETLLNAGDKSARPVLVELAKSRAPLRTFGGPDGMRTVGDAAKLVLAERGRDGDTPRADGE
ncbi:MAG: HEAT repeat domain-containing protein, partial [Planctomycetota bacterium]